MRITCDYCGASFDADTNSSCPKCGGSFGNDPEMRGLADSYKEDRFFQEQMQLKEQQQQRFEARQKELDGQVKKVKIGCVVFAVLLLSVIIIPIAMLIAGSQEAAAVVLNNII